MYLYFSEIPICYLFMIDLSIYLYFWRQSLTKWSSLASILQSSCPGLPSTWLTSMYRHAQLTTVLLFLLNNVFFFVDAYKLLSVVSAYQYVCMLACASQCVCIWRPHVDSEYLWFDYLCRVERFIKDTLIQASA